MKKAIFFLFIATLTIGCKRKRVTTTDPIPPHDSGKVSLIKQDVV